MKLASMARSALASALLLGALACMATPAMAGRVELEDGDTYHDSIFVNTSDFKVTDFHSKVAGTVTLRIKDVGWVDLLESLSTFVSSAGKTVFTRKGNDEWSFQVDREETFSTGIYALTHGVRHYGLYEIETHFKAAPALAPVPLPAGAWLLVSALSLLPALRRRRSANPKLPA